MKFRSVSTQLLVIILICASCTHQNGPRTVEDVQRKDVHVAETDKSVETIRVSSQNLRKAIHLTAELNAFREVAVYPKVQGFVKSIYVDRGSAVHTGQILVEIVAPELEANFRESQAKFEAAKSSLLQVESKIDGLIAQKDEFEAKLEADDANFKRVQIAAQTAGAIAEVDLESAEKNVQAAKARLRSAEQQIKTGKQELQSEKARVEASEQALNSVGQIKSYLIVRAPFDGVISERNVHEGSLVSSSAANPPMLKIEQTSKLRVIVPVPETAIAGLRQGSYMTFTVPAFVGQRFSGKVARISHMLERRSRTMTVELDVQNQDKRLQPGMYAEVDWEMERPYKTLFVPASAVLSANDKTSVLRVKDKKIEHVPILRGQSMGNLVEVVGELKEGDELLFRPAEELKEGTIVETRLVSLSDKHDSHNSHND